MTTTETTFPNGQDIDTAIAEVVKTLLETILTQARRITTADAGSLYLTEREADGGPPKTLRFKLSQNFTLHALACHQLFRLRNRSARRHPASPARRRCLSRP